MISNKTEHVQSSNKQANLEELAMSRQRPIITTTIQHVSSEAILEKSAVTHH